MKNKKLFISAGIVCCILCLYFMWPFSFFDPFGGIGEFFWEMKHRDTDKTTILVLGNVSEELPEGELTEYYETMAFSWAVQDEDYLMILFENYSASRHNEEGNIAYSNGPMGFFNGAVVLMQDQEQERIVKEIQISDGKVIYMDQTQYGIMKHEKVEFYQISTGEMIKEEIIDDFQKDGSYEVHVLGKELKIYKYNGDNNELLEKIQIPTEK